MFLLRKYPKARGVRSEGDTSKAIALRLTPYASLNVHPRLLHDPRPLRKLVLAHGIELIRRSVHEIHVFRIDALLDIRGLNDLPVRLLR